MITQTSYKPVVIGVTSTVTLSDGVRSIGGFACITAGTLTIVNQKGVTIVNAIPVTAGTYISLPFYIENGQGATVSTAGGASGTLGVA